jgi:hypothetical protein
MSLGPGDQRPPMGCAEALALYVLIVGTFMFAAFLYAFLVGALKP